MMIEHVCFLLPDDIKELRVSCTQCGASSTVPAGEFKSLGALIEGECISCHSKSGIARNTDEWNLLVSFAQSLARLSSSLKGRNIQLSLRIDCDK